jgi:hypothetical protein
LILAVELAAIVGLSLLMASLDPTRPEGRLLGIGMLASWFAAAAAFEVRVAGRPRSRSGVRALGWLAAAAAVYLGMSLVIRPPLVPMIAGAVLAGAILSEGGEKGDVALLDVNGRPQIAAETRGFRS